MAKRPLVAFAGCWAAGNASLSLWAGWPAFAAVAGMLMLLLAYACISRMPWRIALALALAVALSAGERAWFESRNVTVLDELLGEPDGRLAVAAGKLISPPDIDGDVVTFRMAVSRIAGRTVEPKEKLLVRVRLSAESEIGTAGTWKRGDGVRVEGELELPGTATNFGGFDYRAYLKRERVHWVLSADGAGAVERSGERVSWPDAALRWIDERRAGIGKLMDELYGEADAGYMKGLVAGIREDLDPEQFDVFAKLGLTHVLAISGLHVGVVVFLLLRLGALFRLSRERSLDATIAAMPVYMLLTGASPSAVRACLMAMLALFLARKNRLKDGLHLLAASALAMLIVNPIMIENVSFQLSFIVTLGLIALVPLVSACLPVRNKSLRGALAVAITAQACSLPVSIFYFHQFHLLSLLSNLVLVPFISFIVMPLGMASVVLGAAWQPVGAYAAWAASWCNRLTFAATGRLQAIDGMQTYWPQPSLLWVAAGYVLLGASAALLKAGLTRRRENEASARRRAERLRREADMRFDAERRASLVAAYAGSLQSEGNDTKPLFGGEAEPSAEWPKPGLTGNAGIVRFGALIALVLWAGWLIWGLQPAWLNRDGSVAFLDVGQGDGILIRTGKGRHILVDAGGTVTFRKEDEAWRERRDPYEVGRKTVVPLLKARGVRELDALVLTHLDQDHIGGAAAVLGAFPVRSVLFNGTLKPAAEALRVFELALRSGANVYAVREGMTWEIDETAQIEVLYPAEETARPDNAIPVAEEQNDRSVVLLLNMYGRRFLLPGDLEKQGEAAVVNRLAERGAGPETAAVDVLKAGHHGSKTSTTAIWLMRWSPGEVVISAGRNNFYGHPHPSVLERLKRMNIPYARTDLNGEIQYRVSPDGRLAKRMKLGSSSDS
ncbi:ComEC/Rec2 family competence protein [Cohnella algarum]|uniref:ComEC/Rec2 family competence protein n=1 Tax=Cohnella algarum TaxID=2044859 RepID=UPI001968127B|nr:ComEC/Rec2 family competence protein [Cohnella algarum]MBN2983265.1 ComEC/Rec2 family competence protein [Cohnella algarum]